MFAAEATQTITKIMYTCENLYRKNKPYLNYWKVTPKAPYVSCMFLTCKNMALPCIVINIFIHELCMHILNNGIIPLGYYKLKLKLKFVNLVVP